MDRFNDAYRGARSAPPWDIGRPQPAFVALAEQDAIRGSVLDAGCGTGEHTLYFASLGHESWGIDGSPLAIERALQKAHERGITVEFRVHDALALEGLGRTFDTVTDCGLFHIFADEDRARYVESLACVLGSGGRYFMLCFSDRQPGSDGPRRISQGEIRAVFADGWRVDEIAEATITTLTDPEGVRGWRSSITRL
jgi:cyclopropane fatty-acyl-phospholipid synthase-like methyltransferase